MKLTVGEHTININLGLPGGGLTLLTICFVVLKVLDYLDWSWLWVFAPLWIPAAIVALVLLVLGVIALVAWRRW